MPPALRTPTPRLEFSLAASTRPLAVVRSLATPTAIRIPPRVLVRLRKIRPAAPTQPWAFPRLSQNTTADQNTAIGAVALFDNTTGTQNTAVGFSALHVNSTGNFNTANGWSALSSNTEGGSNTATGYFALGSNSTGGANTADGDSALASNTTGVFNTAVGNFALPNSDADSNTAVGSGALFNNTTGTGNIALGINAGGGVTDAYSVIAIGTNAENVNNSCYIGQIYSNIQPQVGTDPDLVTISSSGRLGRANVSSRRYKHDIKPMHKASEAIYALKPVSFRYHKQYDATQTTAFGLIAEEVAEVAPDLVGRNEKGEPESVRYEQINAMLLNEFLKEHARVEEQGRKIEKQEATITQLKKDVEVLVARLREHDSKIQRVTDRIETATPESQMALND
jgi:Chaperone of endosialidase